MKFINCWLKIKPITKLKTESVQKDELRKILNQLFYRHLLRILLLHIILIVIIINIRRRAAKNDQPINSRIKCWISAFGDNPPPQQSAIKSLKHSFHCQPPPAQKNDRTALQKRYFQNLTLDYLQSV